MCFAVGKDYGPYVHLNGYTWQMKSDAILVGSAYNTNDSDVKFTYKSYICFITKASCSLIARLK